jgi:hypothetical protein
MAAGFEKTALMASWGAAIPTPPMDLEIGPMLMRLSPLVAEEIPANERTNDATTIASRTLFIKASFLN